MSSTRDHATANMHMWTAVLTLPRNFPFMYRFVLFRSAITTGAVVSLDEVDGVTAAAAERRAVADDIFEVCEAFAMT